MYGELGKDVVEIIKKFMRDEAGELIDGRVHRNYGLYVCSNCTKTECIRVHVVSEREKYLDDFNRHLEYRPKCRGWHFWARGYIRSYSRKCKRGNNIKQHQRIKR